MIIDFRRHAHTKSHPFRVRQWNVRNLTIDSKLNFEANCEAVSKKGHQCLFCLRKRSYFHIDKTMMTLFYHAFMESILSFSLVSRFGNQSLKNRNTAQPLSPVYLTVTADNQLDFK